MNTPELVEAHHRRRLAVIYIRQSTGHQVLSNLESQKMQRAMREHARRFGWTDEQIQIVEADTGNSAQSTENRDGYKNLLSDIALGRVGIVLSYESARLSRNCSDWYPLLDLCAYQRCLIGDRDGVYDPASANGRLLLGMKGILSEIELHTIRGRLIAGVQNKARRGELTVCLPAGLVRLEDGRVVKDPNIQIQEVIDMVFRVFLDLKSGSKVVRHFRKNDISVPRIHRNHDIVWRPAGSSQILGILRNPAYAGAFAFGKYRTVHSPDGKSRQEKRAIEDWTVLIKDHHEGYITWEVFEQIQKILSDNHAEYANKMSRGVARAGSALLQGLVYCGRCGLKMSIGYSSGSRYVCNQRAWSGELPSCEAALASSIDAHVVQSFFEAISPAELDLYDQAMAARTSQRGEIRAAHQRELQRLRYEVELARRQYDRVDPDNRLVAAELERRWESALRSVHVTEERFAQIERKHVEQVTVSLPSELRKAFQSLGQSLPDVWQQESLSVEHRKQLLRCLIDKVVMARQEQREFIRVRIVWRGGAVSEKSIGVTVQTYQELSSFPALEVRVLELADAGTADKDICDILAREGFRSPRSDKLLVSTVRYIRYKNGRQRRRVTNQKPRRVPGFLATPEVAKRLGVPPHWLYRRIKIGAIDVARDPDKKMYLFPDRPDVIEELGALRDGRLTSICIRGAST